MNKVYFRLAIATIFIGSFKIAHSQSRENSEQPNFIIILTDDLGYQDLGCYGSPLIRTPRLDQMAKEGARFTSFYAQTVCGPSRSSIMTGCYPLRVAKHENSVEIHPRMDLSEITIAEVLKEAGYATAAIGKWHLAGHSQTDFIPEKATHPSELSRYTPALLPLRQGFDYYFGSPSSNDFYVNLLRNNSVIEKKADMQFLTSRYTDSAIHFIKTHSKKPFFVYLAHSMPHRIIAASEKFRGKSKRGTYGDVVEELDYNIGRIIDTLRALNLDKNTYVVFTSDNGPWELLKENGGSALPLRGAKTSTWEGGLRVPCIMWAPGKIPAGTVNNSITSTLDLMPTFASIAGASIPRDRIIDGKDITGIISGQKTKNQPPRDFYYYQHTHLQAVRRGKWKLMLARKARSDWGPAWATHIKKTDAIDIPEPMLFNLVDDIGEQHDLAKNYPRIVAGLLALAEKAKSDIGDYNRVGEGARFVKGFPERPDIGLPFKEHKPQDARAIPEK